LHKKARKYPLKRTNYNFGAARADGFDLKSHDDFADYLPSVSLNSSILNFEEFAQVWKTMPAYVKIRVPELFYSSHTDGFNIHNLYRKLAPLRNEYKFALILI